MKGGFAFCGLSLSGDPTFKTCEISDTAGERVCFVRCGMVTGELTFFADETETDELLRVTPRPRLARGPGRPRRTPSRMLRALTANPAHDVSLPDGAGIGAMEKVLGERQYHVGDDAGSERMLVIQESEQTTVKEWLLSSRPFASERFAYWRGDQRLGWHEPDPASHLSTIDMTLDRDRTWTGGSCSPSAALTSCAYAPRTEPVRNRPKLRPVVRLESTVVSQQCACETD